MRRFRRRIGILGYCVLLVGATLFRAPAANAEVFFESYNHPAMWKIENGNTTVYVFGSHHVLQARTDWVPSGFPELLEGIDEFVLEVEPTEEWMPDAQDFIDGSGYLPEGERLSSMLSDDTRDYYRRLLRNLGLDPDEMDRQRPWLALLTLSSAFHGKRKYSVEYGADVRILRYAHSHDKPVRYLETMRQQLEYFAEAIQAAPVEGLERVVTGLRDEPDAIVENIRDWRAGNVDATAMRLHAFFEHNPTARKILLDDRNISWATQIEGMLTNGKTTFVTVGIGHLGGEGSVIDILCMKGWDVRRIPTEDEAVPPACGNLRS